MIAQVRRALAPKRESRDPDDGGSVLILTLGYAVLAIAVILVCTAATSLYLAQKQLDAVADAAALAAADGFDLTVVGGEPVATLTDAGVRREAEAMMGALDPEARLVSASTPDGVSARVRVAGQWQPPIVTVFVPGGVALESTATSRTALR
ncbi:putative membrane protein [Microbacterium sp. BE35]|uniref:pilus assembly protein TadG-related protein n=1 Tax=Microbacterium sp. BE35 TaxID=2817773 RepID=UPI0028571D83|nr:pilus assembly protein TadG-related protein [Microbacterium sp. BE35]MDR7189512.1 putative membrane protein [Microbacterium sp. BE35]